MQFENHRVRQGVLASSRHGGVIKPNGQTAACDRCRGQKMKCVRIGNQSKCQRCRRADAACVVPLPKPMGRPPRKDRAGKASSPPKSNSPDDATETAPTVVSGDVEAAVTSHDTGTYSYNPWDCFASANVFDDFLLPDGLDIESTSDVTDINTNANHASNQPYSITPSEFSSHFTEPQSAVANIATNHPLTVNQRSYDDISILTQLAELNVAIVKHPLYHRKDSHDVWPSATTSAELGVGKLLDLTKQLEVIIKQRRALEENSGADVTAKNQDRPLEIMALSCYANLKMLYHRGVRLLRQIKDGSRKLRDPETLMPGFNIDGFRLDGCSDVKVTILISLFEQVLARLRNCVACVYRPEATATAP